MGLFRLTAVGAQPTQGGAAPAQPGIPPRQPGVPPTPQAPRYGVPAQYGTPPAPQSPGQQGLPPQPGFPRGQQGTPGTVGGQYGTPPAQTPIQQTPQYPAPLGVPPTTPQQPFPQQQYPQQVPGQPAPGQPAPVQPQQPLTGQPAPQQPVQQQPIPQQPIPRQPIPQQPPTPPQPVQQQPRQQTAPTIPPAATPPAATPPASGQAAPSAAPTTPSPGKVQATPRRAMPPAVSQSQAAPPSRQKPSAPAAAGPIAPPQPKVPAKSKPPEVAKPQPPAAPRKKAPPKPVRPKQFVWAFPEEPPFHDGITPLQSAPAVGSRGRIFLHSQGKLVALEEDQGKAKVCWEYVTGTHAPGPPVIGPEGDIRLHSADGYLHVIGPNGRQACPPALVGEPLGYAAPVVDTQGNTWVSAFEGGLIGVDSEGRIRKPSPFFRSRQKLDAGGVVRDDVLCVGSEDGYVFAINLEGKRGKNLWDHAAGVGCTGWYIHSSPAMAEDGTLVIASRDQYIYGFDRDGRGMWRTEMPGQLLASPVIDSSGQIYIGTSLGRRGEEPKGGLVCVDGNSHKVRWQYKAAGPVESTPVIGDDDLIYFGDNAGVIHAVDIRGQASWTAKVEAAVRSAGTIVAAQRVAFGLDNETLVVLECTAKGLCHGGWPKLGGNLAQNGLR